MTGGHDEITEILIVLIEAQNKTKMKDGEASNGKDAYVTDARVQADGANGCFALAASELLDRDLFVRTTSGP